MSKSMNKPKLLHMNGSHTIGICHRWLSKQNQETFFFFAKIYFSNNFEQINSHISTNNTQIIKVVGIVPIFTKHKWMINRMETKHKEMIIMNMKYDDFDKSRTKRSYQKYVAYLNQYFQNYHLARQFCSRW